MKKQEEPEPFEEPLEELPDIEIEELLEPEGAEPEETPEPSGAPDTVSEEPADTGEDALPEEEPAELMPEVEEAEELPEIPEAAASAGEPENAEIVQEAEPEELESPEDTEIAASAGKEADLLDREPVPEPLPGAGEEKPAEAAAAGEALPVANASAGLLDYLLSLTEALPEDKRGAFQRSEYRLKIEALKSRLSGSRGIHTGFSASHDASRPLDPGTVGKSLQFFARFAAFHPEPDVGTLLSERLRSIAHKLSGGSGE